MYTQKEWVEQNMTLDKFLEKVHIKGTSSIQPTNNLDNLWKNGKIYRMDMLILHNKIKQVIYFDKQMRFIADSYLSPEMY